MANDFLWVYTVFNGEGKNLKVPNTYNVQDFIQLGKNVFHSSLSRNLM